jgi:uncharacterized protein YrrD
MEESLHGSTITDIYLVKVKPWIYLEGLYVFLSSARQVIKNHNFVTHGKKHFSKMATNKAAAARN